MPYQIPSQLFSQPDPNQSALASYLKIRTLNQQQKIAEKNIELATMQERRLEQERNDTKQYRESALSQDQQKLDQGQQQLDATAHEKEFKWLADAPDDVDKAQFIQSGIEMGIVNPNDAKNLYDNFDQAKAGARSVTGWKAPEPYSMSGGVVLNKTTGTTTPVEGYQGKGGNGSYTLKPGDERRNANNEVVATGPGKPASNPSALEEKLALAHKTWPGMGDGAVADMVLKNSKSVVGADGRVYTRNDRTGDVTVSDPSSGDAPKTPDGEKSEYLPEISGPNNKLSLYKLAEKVSGPESSVVTSVAPILQNIGVDTVDSGREYARTVYEAAQGAFVQSMMQSSGMRYGGLGMMKEIKKQIDIEPKFWDNWELLQQRLVAVSDFLKTRIAQDKKIIADPTSPKTVVTNAKSNLNASKNFLEIAGVPDDAGMGRPDVTTDPAVQALVDKYTK